MSQKERLVELLNSLLRESWHYDTSRARNNYIADRLLENGVNAPPVQVGQTVYYAFVDSPVIDHVVSFPIVEIRMYEDETIFIDDCDNEWKEQDFGKTVFLTYEEAEAALKEARNEVQKLDN